MVQHGIAFRCRRPRLRLSTFGFERHDAVLAERREVDVGSGEVQQRGLADAFEAEAGVGVCDHGLTPPARVPDTDRAPKSWSDVPNAQDSSGYISYAGDCAAPGTVRGATVTECRLRLSP